MDMTVSFVNGKPVNTKYMDAFPFPSALVSAVIDPDPFINFPTAVCPDYKCQISFTLMLMSNTSLT